MKSPAATKERCRAARRRSAQLSYFFELVAFSLLPRPQDVLIACGDLKAARKYLFENTDLFNYNSSMASAEGGPLRLCLTLTHTRHPRVISEGSAHPPHGRQSTVPHAPPLTRFHHFDSALLELVTGAASVPGGVQGQERRRPVAQGLVRGRPRPRRRGRLCGGAGGQCVHRRCQPPSHIPSRAPSVRARGVVRPLAGVHDRSTGQGCLKQLTEPANVRRLSFRRAEGCAGVYVAMFFPGACAFLAGAAGVGAELGAVPLPTGMMPATLSKEMQRGCGASRRRRCMPFKSLLPPRMLRCPPLLCARGSSTKTLSCFPETRTLRRACSSLPPGLTPPRQSGRNFRGPPSGCY